MFGHIYYHGVIKKYVALFGTLFDDVYVTNEDVNSGLKSSIKVPIAYGPREKVLARLTADPKIDRMPAVTLPRMSFEITGFAYANGRKLNTIGKRVSSDTSPDKLKYQYNPVPYDINFTLSILVKNAEDGIYIVEQILPFFTPEWTTTIDLIPEVNQVLDIPVILDSVTLTDDYEGDFQNRRSIIWTLTFTMKAYVFGPVRKGNIIKFANTNIYNDTSVPNTHLVSVDTRPGLLANGQPTSNGEATIPLAEIQSTDNFGYIITSSNPNG